MHCRAEHTRGMLDGTLLISSSLLIAAAASTVISYNNRHTGCVVDSLTMHDAGMHCQYASSLAGTGIVGWRTEHTAPNRGKELCTPVGTTQPARKGVWYTKRTPIRHPDAHGYIPMYHKAHRAHTNQSVVVDHFAAGTDGGCAADTRCYVVGLFVAEQERHDVSERNLGLVAT